MNVEVQSEITNETILDAAIHALPHRWDYKLAKLISNLFSPPVVITVAMLFVGFSLNAVQWSLAYILAVVGLPTAYVYWLLQSGRIADFHMYERRERVKPMVLTVILATLAWIGLKYAGAPPEITLFAFVGIFQTLLLLIITLFWKISIHTTAIAGLSVLMVAVFGWHVGAVLFSIPLVSWARMRTKNHSFQQILFGTFSGALFITCVLLIISFQCQGVGLICE